jgi:hypothetical protein
MRHQTIAIVYGKFLHPLRAALLRVRVAEHLGGPRRGGCPGLSGV